MNFFENDGVFRQGNHVFISWVEEGLNFRRKFDVSFSIDFYE
jgi:hypothetical protein